MEADDEQKESFDISFEKGKGNFAKPINQVSAIIISFQKNCEIRKEKIQKDTKNFIFFN